MTSTAMMTMTRPTAPQAIMVPEMRPGARAGPAACTPGRGVLPPLPPPARRPCGLLAGLAGGGLARHRTALGPLRSLALWPDGPAGGLGGLGLFPPVVVCSGPVPWFRRPRFVFVVGVAE